MNAKEPKSTIQLWLTGRSQAEGLWAKRRVRSRSIAGHLWFKHCPSPPWFRPNVGRPCRGESLGLGLGLVGGITWTHIHQNLQLSLPADGGKFFRSRGRSQLVAGAAGGEWALMNSWFVPMGINGIRSTDILSQNIHLAFGFRKPRAFGKERQGRENLVSGNDKIEAWEKSNLRPFCILPFLWSCRSFSRYIIGPSFPPTFPHCWPEKAAAGRRQLKKK